MGDIVQFVHVLGSVCHWQCQLEAEPPGRLATIPSPSHRDLLAGSLSASGRLPLRLALPVAVQRQWHCNSEPDSEWQAATTGTTALALPRDCQWHDSDSKTTRT